MKNTNALISVKFQSWKLFSKKKMVNIVNLSWLIFYEGWGYLVVVKSTVHRSLDALLDAASQQRALAWTKRWSETCKPVTTSVVIYFKKTEPDWCQFSCCHGLLSGSSSRSWSACTSVPVTSWVCKWQIFLAKSKLPLLSWNCVWMPEVRLTWKMWATPALGWRYEYMGRYLFNQTGWF